MRRLARSRQAREARHHRRRRAERDRRAERAGRRRQDRSVAGAGRHAVRDAGERHRPPRAIPSEFGDIVVRADSGRRLAGAAARRRPHRTRRAAIFLDRLLRQGPDRGARRLPDAGLQRARPAAERQGQDGGAVQALPQGHRLRACTTTRRASSRPPCTTCVITLREALLLVVAGRLHLPAELAHHASSRPSPSRCR